MNISKKAMLLMVIGLFVPLLLSVKSYATIEFYVVSGDVSPKVNCDFLEIKDNQALCTANRLLISYDLSQVKAIEIVNRGVSSRYLLFPEETRKIINTLAAEKRADRKKNQQLTRKQGKFDFLSLVQQFASYLKYRNNSNTVSKVLLISGLVVFFIGNIGFLVATFRAGILWGLSSLFLPVVSFVFLFVHWRTAAKPFFVILSGIAIVYLGSFFSSANQYTQGLSKVTPSTRNEKVRKKNTNFQCKGKIYCSDMTSCAEATFYLHNCRGTKIDGDNDGIPCERQWCRR